MIDQSLVGYIIMCVLDVIAAVFSLIFCIYFFKKKKEYAQIFEGVNDKKIDCRYSLLISICVGFITINLILCALIIIQKFTRIFNKDNQTIFGLVNFLFSQSLQGKNPYF